MTKNNKKMRGIEKKGSETSNSIIRCHFGRSNVSHWGFGIQYRFRAVHHQNVHCMFIRIFFCSLCCLLSLSYQLREEKKKTELNSINLDPIILFDGSLVFQIFFIWLIIYIAGSEGWRRKKNTTTTPHPWTLLIWFFYIIF